MRDARSTGPGDLLDRRASGILLHPTSLPGPNGCGDIGAPADAFLAWLERAGQRLWQMLPIGPIGYGNSPYSAHSTFAGNTLLISLEALEKEGWLERAQPPSRLPHGRVNYAATARHRVRRLRQAFDNFRVRGHPASFEAFCAREAGWLDDFALYSALKDHQRGLPWVAWPAPLRDREPAALDEAKRSLAETIDFHRFCQWVFDRQWADLRQRSAAHGVALIGDLPIFLAHDSADVWANRRLFFLDERGAPTVVAGVPPDYFSRTGQRWGNPLYRWEVLEREGFSFWIERIRRALSQFDLVRLDHFIGFVRYWEIPASCETAIEGRWRPVPGRALFGAVKEQLGLERLPFIAEDLGAVSEGVFELRDALQLPGLKLLQFAFGDDPQAESFLPHNYERRSVVYTGTHDNDTLRGWWEDVGGEASTRTREQIIREKEAVRRYVPGRPSQIVWNMIRLAMLSVANLSIFPMQDILELGTSARMNRPGTVGGNWEWRLRTLPPERAERLASLSATYGRTGRKP